MAGGGHNSITRPHLLITAPQQHTASNLHSSPPCKVILCNDGGCKKIMLINSLIISYQISPNLSLSTYPELNLSLKRVVVSKLSFRKPSYQRSRILSLLLLLWGFDQSFILKEAIRHPQKYKKLEFYSNFNFSCSFCGDINGEYYGR